MSYFRCFRNAYGILSGPEPESLQFLKAFSNSFLVIGEFSVLPSYVMVLILEEDSVARLSLRNVLS